MSHYHCNIHDIDFSYTDPKGRAIDCPCCMLDQIILLKDENKKVTKQRDVLVEAIGVVNAIRTVS